jgi:hypothetical protein
MSSDEMREFFPSYRRRIPLIFGTEHAAALWRGRTFRNVSQDRLPFTGGRSG